MEKRRAFITGVEGQDGTYLSEHLHELGYEVFGVGVSSNLPTTALAEYRQIDVRDRDRLSDFLREIQPHECYHLAAYHRSSSVQTAKADVDEEEWRSVETNVASVLTILQTLRSSQPTCRVFLAGSCHMFGNVTEMPQTERTPFAPTAIYGVTKTTATHLGRMYRTRGDLFVCTGILYNHESPLRGPDFITSRIARTAVQISRGIATELVVGSLDAQVDWGFAGDYVRAMHLMLQAETANDYIIASGELHHVRDFVERAFARVGLDWTSYVREDVSAYRPVSSSVYHGDPRLIRERLGWKPETSFSQLVDMMVDRYLASA